MMKKTLLFTFIVSMSTMVSRADFVVGNIKYAPLNDREACVTGGTVNNAALVIPETVYDEDEDIEYTVTEIGDDAFNMFGADGARISGSVTLPSTIKRIGDRAFNYQSFGSINLPEGLEYIGANAFDVNRNMHSVTIPSTVEAIGTEAFSRTGLSNVFVKGDIPCEIGSDIFLDVSGTDENQQTVGFHIVVKPSRLADYKSGWSDYSDAITDQFLLTVTGEVPVYAGYGVSPTVGMNTWCSDVTLCCSGATGLSAYIVESIEGYTVNARLIDSGIIPAGAGVIITGQLGAGYAVSIADNDGGDTPSSGLLTGVLRNTSLSTVDGDCTNFAFNDGKFTKFDDSDNWRRYVPMRHAYLRVPTADVISDTLDIQFHGIPSGINTLHSDRNVDGGNTIYGIDGRPVSIPRHGIYIIDGKKKVMR